MGGGHRKGSWGKGTDQLSSSVPPVQLSNLKKGRFPSLVTLAQRLAGFPGGAEFLLRATPPSLWAFRSPPPISFLGGKVPRPQCVYPSASCLPAWRSLSLPASRSVPGTFYFELFFVNIKWASKYIQKTLTSTYDIFKHARF